LVLVLASRSLPLPGKKDEWGRKSCCRESDDDLWWEWGRCRILETTGHVEEEVRDRQSFSTSKLSAGRVVLSGRSDHDEPVEKEQQDDGDAAYGMRRRMALEGDLLLCMGAVTPLLRLLPFQERWMPVERALCRIGVDVLVLLA
jgi:hypothetical protein